MKNNKLLILDGTSLVNDSYNCTLTKEMEEANHLYDSAKTEDEKENALKAKKEAYKTLLQSTSGEFINAVQEFFKNFLEILDKQNPSHVVVAWGTPRATNYKREIFDGYKNNNKEMDEPLKQQFESIKGILNEIGVAQYRSEKYEALDIAGSIANKFKNVLPTCIVARNQNSLQLCNNSTVWLKTSSRDKLSEQYNLNLDNVAEKFMEYTDYRVNLIHQLTPTEFVDYRALIGNPSSGIPGVKGIGEKSALPIIKHFGSLENMYRKIHEVKEDDLKNPKDNIMKKYIKHLKEVSDIKRFSIDTLLDCEEDAFISKKLVSIKTDILLEDKQLDINIDKIILVKEMKRYDLANIEVVNNNSVLSSDFSELIRTFSPTILSPSSEEYVGDSLKVYIQSNYKNDNSYSEYFDEDCDDDYSRDDYYYEESDYEDDSYEEDDDYYYEESDYEDNNNETCVIVESNNVAESNKEKVEVSYTSEQTTIDDLINRKNAFTILEVVTAFKYQCNHCNEFFTTEGKPAKFCPHCGTKNNTEDSFNIPVIEKSNCNLSDMKLK